MGTSAFRKRRYPGESDYGRDVSDGSSFQERQRPEMAETAAVLGRGVRVMLEGERGALRANHGAEEQRDNENPRDASRKHLQSS